MSEIRDNVIDNSWGVIDLGWDNVINKSLDNIFSKNWDNVNNISWGELTICGTSLTIHGTTSRTDHILQIHHVTTYCGYIT